MKAKYLSIFAIFAALTFNSCSDFLDKVPDTRVYLTTADQLRELLVDGYMGYSYAMIGELSSDNVIDNNSPSETGVRYNLAAYSLGDTQIFAWEDETLDNGSDTPSEFWTGCYAAIAVANAVLEKVDEFEVNGTAYGPLTATEKEKLSAIKGEALLIRAFHHWMLCNVFCMPWRGPELSKQCLGIPYITHPETTVQPHYERGTLAEDYEKIEKDLVEGLPLINDQLYEVPKYHFNRAAANAFAARFYLFKREYDKAEEYATASFKGNDPATLMNDIWSNSSFYYISDIGRYATSIERPGVFMCFSNYSTWWRRFVQSGRYACNRDAKRATVQGPGPSWSNCQYKNSRTKEVFAMHPAFNGYCGTAGGQEYGAYYAGTCFEQFEYTDKLAGIGYCHGVRAEFTAEEMLLVRAEARLFLGKIDDAFEDLNIWDQARQNNVSGDDRMVPLTKELIVRFYETRDPGYGIVKEFHIDEVCPSDRYHMSEEINAYMQCVQHFRRIETVHTGMRWFDIKRYGFEITHNVGLEGERTLHTLDDRYAIQIPYDVIAAGMESTPRRPESAYQTAKTDETVESRSNYVIVND